MNAQGHIYSFWMELIYKHEFQNLAMTLQLNFKRGLLANILMTKKCQANVKQTWIADIRSNVLNHPIQNRLRWGHAFHRWIDINDAHNVCTTCQKGVFRRSKRVSPQKLFSSLVCNFSLASVMPSSYSLCNLLNLVWALRDMSVYSQLNYLGVFILHCFVTFNGKWCWFNHSTNSDCEAIINYKS